MNRVFVNPFTSAPRNIFSGPTLKNRQFMNRRGAIPSSVIFEGGCSILRLTLACFAALIMSGLPAYGRLLSESNDAPRPILRQPPHAYAATFYLSSFRTNTDSANGGGFGPMTFSLQQQPFSDPPIRLRDDNPEYNKKSSLGAVALRVVSANVFIGAVDRFVFNYSYSHSGPKSWKNNFKKGWQWDIDRFGVNFFFHPLSGAAYFNSARSNGYRYFESVPFVFFGSLMWEYFGETTRPAYNDIINTTASGGEAQFEATLNLAKMGQATAVYYVYRLHTYIGPAGDNVISVFKPRIAVKLFNNLSLGFEYLYYSKDNILRDFPHIHKRSSEQKLYLMLYF